MKHITLAEYFGWKITHADATPERIANATVMLAKVNALLLEAQEVGKIRMMVDFDTKCLISGSPSGQGDGGFRLQSSVTGALKSAHRQGFAIDIYDPAEVLDNWIGRNLLIKHGLWRESPAHTKNWCHLQSIAPKSGTRSFNP